MMHGVFKHIVFDFAAQDWLHEPWNGVSKGMETEIMDYGFKLAYVLELNEHVAPRPKNIEVLRKMVRECTGSIGAFGCLGENLQAGSQANRGATREGLPQDKNRMMLEVKASMIELGIVDAAQNMVLRARESNRQHLYDCELESTDSDEFHV